MRNFEIQREEECNCDLYTTADSVTLLIYKAIRGYFSGLAHISNNELTAYNPGALQKALTEGNFGDKKIEKEQVDAYTNIYKILLRATADLYRKKKIKQYIEEANQPIQVLIHNPPHPNHQDTCGLIVPRPMPLTFTAHWLVVVK